MSTSLLIVLSIILIIVGFTLALIITPLLGFENKKPGESITPDDDLNIIKKSRAYSTSDRYLRIDRDLQRNQIRIELNGQVYYSISELNPEQRRFLSSTMKELGAWMSESEVEPKPSTQPSNQTASPVPKAEYNSAESKPTNPERSVVNTFLRSLQPSGTKMPPQPKSLAAQVDEVLQEKLPYSSLSQHTIHLIDLPDYGMSVQVDREKYPSIDAVPDEAIRKFIREAVEEWKRRSSLGS